MTRYFKYNQSDPEITAMASHTQTLSVRSSHCGTGVKNMTAVAQVTAEAQLPSPAQKPSSAVGVAIIFFNFKVVCLFDNQ